MISLAGEEVSYENLIQRLMELEPVEDGGQLSLKPRFFSLSLLAQSRYLFRVIQQHDKISTSALHHFTHLLESYPYQNPCITHGILQLKKCTYKDRDSDLECGNIEDDRFMPTYVFTKKSEKLKDEVIRKLLHCNDTKINQINTNSKQCVEMSSETGLEESLHIPMKNVITEEIQRSYKRTKGYQLQNKTACINLDSNGDSGNSIIITSDSDDTNDIHNGLSSSRKRKLAHQYSSTGASFRPDSEENKSIVIEDKVKKQNKNSCLLDKSDEVLQDEGLACTGKTQGQTGSFQEFSAMKFQLSSLRESLFSDSRDESFPTQFWDCFMNVNHAQLSEACEFLMLKSVSENILLTLCDCLSSLNLSHQVEAAFLNSCVSEKLSSLTERASHTLLNILYSAIQQKPKITIEIISKSLENTKSGEHQCQVALSLCKSSFPIDCFSFFIQQLSTRKIQFNVHLTSALQALVNRVNDLNTDTLKLLLSMLSKHSEILCTCAPFGKLLLTIISKFKTNIAKELWTLMDKMVDDHKSSLKGMLQKKLEFECE